MTAKQLLDEGRLSAAIEHLGTELKSRPGDLQLRAALFEALCFAGDLDRAGRQLEAIGHLDTDPMAALGCRVYQGLLESERQRAGLFAADLRPRFLLEPPALVTMHLDALGLLRDGRTTEARSLLDQAEALRTPRSGTCDGKPFDDLRDADDVLGPVLEVFAPAGYAWVPWEHIQFLAVSPPRTWRDLLWAPARLATCDGQLGEVFLPALYPNSSAHPDEQVHLGRKTDWLETGGIVRGAGLKTFLVGDEARTLLELGEVQLTLPGDLH
ncbi:MAG: tetratricopeptide repeat protein [Isosphaeraceae bacterium]|nr:tetratricopeptide repeat protein [Isosphaeraceae bacterium]